MECEVCKDKTFNNSKLCENCFNVEKGYLNYIPLRYYIIDKHIVLDKESLIIAIHKIENRGNYMVRVDINCSRPSVIGGGKFVTDMFQKEKHMPNWGMICFIEKIPKDWNFRRIKITGFSKNERTLFAIAIN